MALVGYRTGLCTDKARRNWSGMGDRPLTWAAWYPAASSATPGGTRTDGVFHLGEVAVNAELAAVRDFPVVLLSHGTGGTPESLGWLASRLAGAGYVAIGAYHHGNTGREPYRAEGFLCWWERATDLSELLTLLNTQGPFADRLDLTRVHAVGFSLGGHTVLALAGARTTPAIIDSWIAKYGKTRDGPREFPDVVQHIPRLLETSSTFRVSWERQSLSFADDRIRSVVAIAPAPTVSAFDKPSLKAISIPVTLITGEADDEAPAATGVDWLAAVNPQFRRISAGRNVGHYTFLGHPTQKVTKAEEFLFTDKPGVVREDVHDLTATHVLSKIGEVW